jgi:3-hydroxyisobutyrate dehydrogenase-like beta-hydroxyacid dehydrogenase
VLLVVADATALEEVLTGPDGVFAGLRPNATVIVLSTISPDTVRALEPQVTAAGGRLLEAAMLGNGSHAEQGELRLYLGGDPQLVDRESDLLTLFAKEVTAVGPLGSGMSYKLVLNLLMGLEMQALAEITALGEGLGLDRGQLLSVVAGSGFSAPVMRFKAQRMIRRSYADPDFRLALMAKDLRLATDEATRHDVLIPMTRVATAEHREAVEAGLGELDCAAITDARSGVPA